MYCFNPKFKPLICFYYYYWMVLAQNFTQPHNTCFSALCTFWTTRTIREVQIRISQQRKLTAQRLNHKGRVSIPQISELLQYRIFWVYTVFAKTGRCLRRYNTAPMFCMFYKRGLLPLHPVEHTKLRSCTSVRFGGARSLKWAPLMPQPS